MRSVASLPGRVRIFVNWTERILLSGDDSSVKASRLPAGLLYRPELDSVRKYRDLFQLRRAGRTPVHRVQNDLLLLAKRGISMVVPYHLRISGSSVFPRSLNEYLPCQNKVGSAKDSSWILTFAQFFCWNKPCRPAKVVFY
jgi:hypothetical protein